MDKPKYTEPFSHPRWKDIPHPRIIGEEEITPEEEEKSRRFLEECIQRNMKLREELLLTQYNYNLLNARQYLDNSIRSQFMKLKWTLKNIFRCCLFML